MESNDKKNDANKLCPFCKKEKIQYGEKYECGCGAQTKPKRTEKTYSFYSDPGHGWLKVKKSELVSLGIQDKVSGFSYVKEDNVYLEEDCDASLFLTALKQKGIEAKIKEFNTNRSSKIRNYNRYKGV